MLSTAGKPGHEFDWSTMTVREGKEIRQTSPSQWLQNGYEDVLATCAVLGSPVQRVS